MTREKALIILNECRLGGFARTLYTKEEYCTARDMAIRALEEHETVTEFADRCRECGREKVLDKISAEIMNLTDGEKPERVWNVDVLEILDKYKVESEDKDEDRV